MGQAASVQGINTSMDMFAAQMPPELEGQVACFCVLRACPTWPSFARHLRNLVVCGSRWTGAWSGVEECGAACGIVQSARISPTAYRVNDGQVGHGDVSGRMGDVSDRDPSSD